VAVSNRNSPQQLDLGNLPCETIRKTLGIELDEAKVVFSVAAQKHALRRHKLEYTKCLPYLGSIIGDPLYMGDDAKNPGKIEFVSRVPSLGFGILVALSIEKTDAGYNVCSIYPVSFKKIEARKQSKHLKTCVTK